MRLIGEQLGPTFRILNASGPIPSLLSLSAASLAENAAQGVTIGILTAPSSSNPTNLSILSSDVPGAVQIASPGTFPATIQTGATPVNYDLPLTGFNVTFQFDDDAGTHQVVKRFTITDVADGPTVTGATSTLATLLGTPTVNSLTTFDMRNAWVSPTGQTMTFVPSYGTIAGDGFTFNWTPTAQEFSDANGEAAFSVTATDEDSQSALDVAYVTMATVNTAPTLVAQDLEYLVPEGAAPALVPASSVPADNGADIAITVDPVVVFDRDILLGATGTVTVYDVTGTAAEEVFNLATDVGSSPGQIEQTAADRFTLHMTADFANSNDYAIQFSAGAVTNLGGIPVAALSDTTTLNFTTVAAASSRPVFVGGFVQGGDSADFSVSLTGLTGGIASAPAENDVVVVYGGPSGTSYSTNVGIKTAGWTEAGTAQGANDTRKAQSAAHYKLMSATPDTTIDFYGSGFANVGTICVVSVWRNVNPTTILDVAVEQVGGFNGGLSDPPSITPITTDAVILAMGLGTLPGGSSNVFTPPAGLSNVVSGVQTNSTTSVNAFIGSFDWVSGAYDPAAATGGGSTGQDAWNGKTLALRPA